MAADPSVREALTDPRVRKMMKDMGLESAITALEGDWSGRPAEAGSSYEVSQVFEKVGRKLRALITRGEVATEVLVLSSSGTPVR